MARVSYDKPQILNDGELDPIADISTDGLTHPQCSPPQPPRAAGIRSHIKFKVENILDKFPKDAKAQSIGETYLIGSHRFWEG